MTLKERENNICKVCSSKTKFAFQAIVLKKYKVNYFSCTQCGFLQTEHPYWLEDAYKEPIKQEDTGILARNLYLQKSTIALIGLFFNRKDKFLDYAGGYGIFTRLMRDIGFDFYRKDPFTQNLMAKGFEYDATDEIGLLTSFESFEHLEQPLIEIKKMLKISDNIFFSTTLLPDIIPAENRWYYGFSHGQHIAFYSLKTLQTIAKKFDLNLYSNGSNLHLFTKHKIPFGGFWLKIGHLLPKKIFTLGLRSKTVLDMNYIIKSTLND